jgi:Putative beta-barrel porin 2
MAIRLDIAVRHLLLGAVCPMIMLASAAKAQVLPDFGAGGDIGNFGNLNPLTGVPGGQTPLLAYGADVGLAETDNVFLSSTNKVTQTIAEADGEFAVNQQTRLFGIRAAGAFSDLNYLEGAYGNEFIGRADGLAQYTLIPEHLAWVLRDDFGQSTLDAFTPVTPNNRQDINYVATGPNLYLRLGSTGFLNASARYADAYYQTSPFDSTRALVTLGTGLQLSARSNVSINGAAERVLFKNTEVNNDFDHYSVFGRYEAHGARTDLAVNLGGSRVEQKGDATGVTTVTALGTSTTTGSQTVTPVPTLATTGAPHDTNTTGPLARLELSRTLSPSAKLTLTAGRELTDASSSFTTQQGGAIGLINDAPTPLTSDVYAATRANVAWQYTRYRTVVTVIGRWERDRYPGASEFDLTTEGVDLNVQRRLSSQFTAQLLGRWYKSDYPNATVATDFGSPENDSKQIGGALSWRRGRWLEVKLRYEHISYSVSQGNGGYDENRVLLTVGYQPTSADSLGGLQDTPPP